MSSRPHRLLGVRALQLVLFAAALAAGAILVSLFGDAVQLVCLGVIVVATILTAPMRGLEGGGWWSLLAVGALASVAGAALAELTETVGGLVAVLGGALVVVGAAIGFPLQDYE